VVGLQAVSEFSAEKGNGFPFVVIPRPARGWSHAEIFVEMNAFGEFAGGGGAGCGSCQGLLAGKV